MNIDLSGKTALVTGSTEGIGFGIAQGLANAGARVIVNGRTQAKVDAAVARIGGSARGVAADLAAVDGQSNSSPPFRTRISSSAISVSSSPPTSSTPMTRRGTGTGRST